LQFCRSQFTPIFAIRVRNRVSEIHVRSFTVRSSQITRGQIIFFSLWLQKFAVVHSWCSCRIAPLYILYILYNANPIPKLNPNPKPNRSDYDHRSVKKNRFKSKVRVRVRVSVRIRVRIMELWNTVTSVILGIHSPIGDRNWIQP